MASHGGNGVVDVKPAPVVDVKPGKDGAASGSGGKRKRSSKVGDTIFVAYNLAFVAAVAAGYYDLIPVFDVERASLAHSREWAVWMGHNWQIPLGLSAAYVVLVFAGQAFMQNRPAMDLRMPLALWSLLLAVFSFAGAVRTVPALIRILRSPEPFGGVKFLTCGDSRYSWLVDDPAGWWTMVFCLSKIPELLDTAFIVLRKKELIVLHWFHHFTVLCFCWQSWATCCVNGIIFAAMNLTVHSAMYFFYALTALGYRPTTFAQSITIGQILQMVVGVSVTGYVLYDKFALHPVNDVNLFSMDIPAWIDSPKFSRKGDLPCHVSTGNAVSGALMYASYLALFLHFYFSTYVNPTPGKAKAE